MGLCHGKRVGEYRPGRIPENPTRASRQPLRPVHANCCHSQTQSPPFSANLTWLVHVSPSTPSNAVHTPADSACVAPPPLPPTAPPEYTHLRHRVPKSD